MGYKYYTLKIPNVSTERQKRIIVQLRNLYKNAELAFDGDGIARNCAQWYSLTKNMKEFSKIYPDLLFIIEGEGNEHETFWKEYHKNGKVQIVYPDLIWPKFDEGKLR